ncbi:hypothetical protein ACPWSR_05410 [Alloiococcus sp. CFN-8]|uniref:hypothetical protein n=1 Tax=Alloiococcus sp. CFN-8 TaxID=3416081 RepID=UPI003CEBC623
MKKTRRAKPILIISAILTVILVITAVVILRVKPNVDKIISGLYRAIIVSPMKSETHGSITYYYENEGNFNEGMKFWYDSVVPEAHSIGEQYFGAIDSKKPDIVIFPDEKTKKTYHNINNVAAWYLGEENSIYLDHETIGVTTFVHEYIHYITYAFCQENNISFEDIPAWFIEGIAEYISMMPGGYDPNSFTLEGFVAFEEINELTEFQNLVDKGLNPYIQSYAAIHKLIELKGQEAITRIILRTKDVDFYTAFEEEVGMPFQEFQSLVEGLLSSN